MAIVKNLVFTNNGTCVHSAHTLREDSLLKAYLNENIGSKSFKNDSTLECALFSSNTKIIFDSAFENCRNLQIAEYEEVEELKKEVKDQDGNVVKKAETAADLPILGNDVKGGINLSSSENEITVQHQGFKDCSKLHTIVFPKNCNVVIEKEAFLGCTELRTVVLWKGDADIDDGAFIGCDTDKLVFVTNSEELDCDVIKFAREHGFRYVIADNCR
ncbi:MAG: leucine-rich repeat protein [Treponema sp.]|nr:leucine-rich repeat protein [Treponema sp.]MBR0099785.1 leucine-rich repeat protein [Treponema sp.]